MTSGSPGTNPSPTPWLQVLYNGRTVVNPSLLAEHVRESGEILLVGNKMGGASNFYLYENGVYRHVSNDICKAHLKELIPLEHRNPRDWENAFRDLAASRPTVYQHQLNSDEELMNFSNGYLHLGTGELIPHTPKCYSTIQLPCKYQPDLTLDDAPVFKKFLRTLTDDDDDTMATLLEIIGLVVSNVRCSRFKKALYLVGLGNTGKSVLLSTVQALIGRENYCSIDLRTLSARFGTSKLLGMRLAGAGDMSDARVEEMAILKQLTGNDELHSEFKGRDSFTFLYSGFLWFNGNGLPKFGGDRGEHVYSRLIPVPCNNVISPEERDPALLEKILTEKEAIVCTAIRYLQAAIRRGYTFTESEAIRNCREAYKVENNSLLSFIKECCILHEGRTERAIFHNAYRTWCAQNGLRFEKTADITRIMADSCHLPLRKSNTYYYDLSLR